MFKNSKAFSSFSVRNVDEAKRFYGQTLGLEVSDVPGMSGLLELHLAGGARIFVYPKPDHAPASFTILNFPVDNVERAVDALVERGVRFEIYPDGPVKTDSKGIARDANGPKMAWFKDPSGNVLSVLEERR